MRNSMLSRLLALCMITTLSGCAISAASPGVPGMRSVNSLTELELQTIRRERGPIILVDREPPVAEARHEMRRIYGLGPDKKMHSYLLDLCTGELLENGTVVLQYPGEWGGSDVCGN